MIGIDTDNNILYEGAAGLARQIGSALSVCPANLVLRIDDEIKGADTVHMLASQYVFRELESDHAAGFRRGIFYRGLESQPGRWHILAHDQKAGSYGSDVLTVNVLQFGDCGLSHLFKNAERSQPLVCLGSVKEFSVGMIQSVEVNAVGHEIVTLKMRKQFGLLPELIKDVFEQADLEKIDDKLRLVRDAAATLLPEAIVDRCRDAAALLISIKVNNHVLDLGLGIKELKKVTPILNVAIAAADIIRIYHSRPKPSVQAQHGELPDLTEQDAELAIRCLGSVMCELGFAKWH